MEQQCPIGNKEKPGGGSNGAERHMDRLISQISLLVFDKHTFT